MNKKIIPNYLANVFAVIRADNVVADSERSAFDVICGDIGAKKTEITKAEKLASALDYEIKLTGRYSEKLRNIEDMIYVSLADGELGAEESAVITPLIQEMGIDQSIVDVLVSEAQARLTQTTQDTSCPECGAGVAGESKFCPECGAQLAVSPPDEKGVQADFHYPVEGIAIEFVESTAASFDTALALAQQAPELQLCERFKKQWHLASWPMSHFAETVELADALKSIKNRKVYIDGEQKDWKEVFEFRRCFGERNQAYRPIEYCFGLDDNRLNVWGCKKARMDWTEWADWFSYGSFVKKDVFAFDKKRIRHELETNLYKVRYCPCIRFELVEKVMELLPDKVKISDRSDWNYSQSYSETPGALHIRRKHVESGYAMVDEFWADGVRPKGYSLAIKILKEALKACGVSNVDVKALAAGN